jgi:quercetin dioxygenase-like cupin family protein
MRYFFSFLPLLAFVASGHGQDAPVPVEQEPHHRIVLRNDSVLVMRVNLPPGESTLYHTHYHDRAAIDLANNTVTQQKPGGLEEPPSTSKPGEVFAFTLDNPFTHRVKNVGSGLMDLIDVELLTRPKQPAGPAVATVAAENLSARIYRWTLAPGTVSPMHSHERPYLIVAATPMKLKMSAPDGRSLSEEVKPGDFHWVDAKVTHSLANEGGSAGEIVEVELK